MSTDSTADSNEWGSETDNGNKDQAERSATSGKQGRAAYHPGSTTQGGSDFGQGSSQLGGESYHQGSVENDGADYENENDGLARAGTDELRRKNAPGKQDASGKGQDEPERDII